MDATTIERLKHAQEVLGWKIDGKEFDFVTSHGTVMDADVDAAEWVDAIMAGGKYRLKPAKTIRPFTEVEARRLVGCVFVSPKGNAYVCTSVYAELYRKTLMSEKWHYHLPGDPDNLKPCWVEE